MLHSVRRMPHRVSDNAAQLAFHPFIYLSPDRYGAMKQFGTGRG